MRRNFLAAFGILALTGAFLVQPSDRVTASQGLIQQVARGTLHTPIIHAGKVNRRAPMLAAGTIAAVGGDPRGEMADENDNGGTYLSGGPGTIGCNQRNGGDTDQHSAKDVDNGAHHNVRVNQDCTFRRQAEEDINYNPVDPSNLVAGQNDSRVGYNQCGIDWSKDNGKLWGDMLPPFRQKVNFPALERPTAGDPNSHTVLDGAGTLHTYDVGSDPVNTVDTRGNAYFSCVAFDVASNASMLYVVRSPAAAKGSFYYNIPSTSRRYIVDEDNSPHVFNDKNWITADRNPGSPNRDNIYVTWTLFRSSLQCGQQPAPPAPPVEQFCASPIFGSMSTDHGQTFSTPEEISGSSTTLCFLGNFFDPSLSPSACDFNQGSNPVALPNGDLEVIFNNGNTPKGNPNGQQLGVHCHPTGSSPAGTAHLNCASPSLVGKDITVGEPQCDFGRGPEECIPGPYIRTNDFPRIVTNSQNNHLYATWQDYRNGEYDIQLSQSLDGGLTWHEVGTVNPDRGLDHYMPAVDQSPRSDDDKAKAADADNGDRVGDSYYRSARVPNENTTPPAGFTPCPDPQTTPPTTCQAGVQDRNSDYVLAGGRANKTPYNFTVLSPVFPPPDGIQTGFNGDYSAMVINRGTEAHPIWSDTRNVNPFPENGVAHDEDVFTVAAGLPSGIGHASTGRIGWSDRR